MNSPRSQPASRRLVQPPAGPHATWATVPAGCPVGCAWVLAWAALALAGCATWDASLPVPDVRPQRLERSHDAIQAFEAKRDEAQFQAAVSHWKQRHVAACRQTLESLVARNPDHRDGQLMLLELLLAENQTDAAWERAEAIKGLVDDAAVQHARGLAYDAAGDETRAAECYRQAARLEPQNEVYVASFESALEGEEELQMPPEATGPGASALAAADDEPAATPLTERADEPPDGAHPAALLLRAEVLLALGHLTEAQDLADALLRCDPEDALARQLVERIDRGAARLAAAQRRGQRSPASIGLSSHQPLVKAAHHAPAAATSASPSEATSRKASGADSRLLPATEPPNRPGQAPQRLARDASRPATENEEASTKAAVLALQHDQAELAAQLAQDALASFPRSAALHRVLGTAHYRLGRWKAAQSAFTAALDLDNTNALAYFLMGSTLSKLGQAEAADWHLRRARQLDPRYAVGR